MSTRVHRGLLPRRCPRAAVTAWIIATACWGAAAARGEVGELITLPQGAVRPEHHLRLQIDTRWVDGSGYRPITVQLAHVPAGPSPVERRITLEITAQSWRRRAPRVRQEIVLPQGQATSRTVMLVPQSDNWNELSIKTWEGNRLLEELSLSHYLNVHHGWSEGTPVVLVIDRDVPRRPIRDRRASNALGGNLNPEPGLLPDIRILLEMMSETANNYSISYSTAYAASDDQLLNALHETPHMQFGRPDELPENWLAYTSVDIVTISWEDARRLATSQPGVWDALRAWTHAGGTLLVYGAGQDVRERIDALLGDAVDQPSDIERWRTPPPELAAETMIPVANMNPPTPPVVSGISGDGTGLEDLPPPFTLRSWGLGTVVAWPDSPFPGYRRDWAWMFHTLGNEQALWYQRHGLSLDRDNRDFWNWLIPGAGMPPVASFLTLITLFVVVIGPVNFFVLKRTGRLHLLLLTVPLGAVLVTLGLLGYALIVDGLGVQTRVRSVTFVEQSDGRFSSWSRQTYYAAITPGSGLAFPDNTAVYQLVYQPWSERRRNVRVNWDGDSVRLSASHLRSRTPGQFLVIRPGRTDRVVERRAMSEERGEFQNRLGTEIELLVVPLSETLCYLARDVPDAGTVTLEPVSLADGRRELQRLLNASAPAFPEGFDPDRYRHQSVFGRGYWYSAYDSLLAPSTATSLLERELAALPGRLRGLGPGGYVAVTRQGVEVPLGLPRVRDRGSLHVVVGRW